MIRIPKPTSEDYMVCPQCNGRGKSNIKQMRLMRDRCSKCLGQGQLTWLENVSGIQRLSFSKLKETNPMTMAERDWWYEQGIRFIK